jgi:glutamate-1-semialdehyde 2,1-aminomutase
VRILMFRVCGSCRSSKRASRAHNAMDFRVGAVYASVWDESGILLTPFHNMALMSPQTDSDDVDPNTKVFRQAVRELAQ